MKKYTVLLIATFLLAGSAFLIPVIARQSRPYVDVMLTQSVSVSDSTICRGTIEESEQEEVKLDMPVIAQKIYVAPNQNVQKGEKLFDIDLDRTREALQNLQTSALLNSNALPQYDLAGIPESVYAPCSGAIKSIHVKTSSLSDPSQTLMTLSNASDLQVSAKINENQIANIQLNQSVIFTGSGFKDHAYEGYVKSIAATAQQTLNGTATETVVEVVMGISHPDEKLKPGFSVKAEIVTARKENAIVVPYESVEEDQEAQEYVYVVVNQVAYKRPIETGREIEAGLEVKSGLQPGEWVVQDAKGVKNRMPVKTFQGVTSQ